MSKHSICTLVIAAFSESLSELPRVLGEAGIHHEDVLEKA